MNLLITFITLHLLHNHMFILYAIITRIVGRTIVQ